MWSITALSSDSSSALSGTLPGRSSLRDRSESSVSACEILPAANTAKSATSRQTTASGTSTFSWELRTALSSTDIG